MPTTMPMMAPKIARITASDRIMVRTWRRRMPTARSRPISRVRSKHREHERVHDADERDDHRQGEQGVDQPEQLVDAGHLGLLELGPGLDLHVRVGGQGAA